MINARRTVMGANGMVTRGWTVVVLLAGGLFSSGPTWAVDKYCDSPNADGHCGFDAVEVCTAGRTNNGRYGCDARPCQEGDQCGTPHYWCFLEDANHGCGYWAGTTFLVTGLSPDAPDLSTGKQLGKPLDCEASFGNPCDVSYGNKFERAVDYAGPIDFVRYYNSLAVVGEAGFGTNRKWSHNYGGRVEWRTNDGDPGTVGFDVIVQLPDGRRDTFIYRAPGVYYSSNDARLELRFSDNGTPAPNVADDEWIIVHEDARRDIYSARTGWMIRRENAAGQTTTLTYVDNRLVTVRGPFGHTLSLTYETSDPYRVLTLTGPDNYVVSYGYDGNGNLDEVIYPDNKTLTYHYDLLSPQEHLLTGKTNELGQRTTTYGYDTLGYVISAERGGGQQAYTFDYDRPNGVSTVTDAKNQETVLTFTTDDQRRRPTEIDPPGTTPSATRTYDARNRRLVSVDDNGHTTERIYDDYHLIELVEAKGEPVLERRTKYLDFLSNDDDLPGKVQTAGVTGPFTHEIITTYEPGTSLPKSIEEKGFAPGTPPTAVSRTVTMQYNAHRQLIEIDGPRTDATDITQLDYWSDDESGVSCDTGPGGGRCGQLKSVTNALGHVTTYDTYNPHGQLTQMTDPNDLITTYTYDDRLRLETVTETPASGGVGHTTVFKYEDNGLLDYVETPDGVRLTHTHNAAHELTRITDDDGNYLHYGYDLNGNRDEEYTYDAQGVLERQIDYVYNQRDRLSTINRAGDIVGQTFDGVGNLDVLTDARQFDTDRDYDALDRLIEVIEVIGTTSYEHDVNDRVTKVTDDLGRETVSVYDDLGNLLSTDSPDTGLTAYTYDDAGNRKTMLDARGVMTTYAYDALNRLTAIAYPNDPGVTFTYDDLTVPFSQGRLTKMVDESGTTTYMYDARGNLASETRTIGGAPAHTLAYTYDENRRLETLTYPSGRVVTYGRDGLGRIDTVTLADGPTTDNIATNLKYAPFGPAVEWTLGNTLLVRHPVDDQYRIEDSTLGPAPARLADRTLLYDANSNVEEITNNDDADRTQVFTYDAIDRLVSADTALYGLRDFELDTVGNRTAVLGNSEVGLTPDISALVTEYTYGEHNRLREVKKDSIVVGTYTYNGHGERVRKVASGTTTHFHYGPNGELLAETDGAGTVLVEYTYLHGKPLAMVLEGSPAEVYYYHTDHLGTPQMLTDDTQLPVWEADYTPYGTAVDAITPMVTNRLRFPGQYFDEETGTYYNYFRDYEPSTGRYITSDPIGLAGGLNTYQYALANPVRYTDPTGQAVFLLPAISPALTALGKAAAFVGSAALAGMALSEAVNDSERSNDTSQPNREIFVPERVPGKWVCKARADCNDNIPGNCPVEPKRRFAFGGGVDKDFGVARNIAKSNATHNLACQPKHVSCKCTGPKGEQYSGGC